MKKALIISLAILVCALVSAAPAFAQYGGDIGIYADANGNSCDLSDVGTHTAGFAPAFFAYVVHSLIPDDAVSSQWAAPIPTCATFQHFNDNWLAGSAPFGDTQTGVARGDGDDVSPDLERDIS